MSVYNRYCTLLLTALITWVSQTTIAQSVTLSGNVQNQNRNPVEFVSVAVYADSIFLASASTDVKGVYRVDVAAKSKYTIRYSLLGFIKHELVITNPANPAYFDVPLVTLLNDTSKTLKTITVVSKSQLFERKIDRYYFNVENSLFAKGGNAFDAVKATPGVHATELGNISAFGKSIGILIDDRLIQLSGDQLMSFLSSIKAEDIKRIEVITNPPARYDAEGLGGLLNIVLKKDKRLGFNGSSNFSYQQNTYAKYQVGATGNYRTKSWNMYASLNLAPGEYLISEVMGQTYNQNTLPVYYNQENTRTRYQLSTSTRTGIDFFVNPRFTIGVLYIGSFGLRKPTDQISTNISTSKATTDSVYKTSNTSTLASSNNSFNLNGKLKIDSAGSALDINLDYLSYNSTNDLYNSTSFYDQRYIELRSPALFSNTTFQDISIKSAKLDYTKQWTSDRILEIGGKISQSITDNDFIFNNYISGSYKFDATKSNHFIYSDNIFAAYCSYQGKAKKLEYKVGARYEYTFSKGRLITTNQINERSYARLFPTVYLLYSFDDKNKIGFDVGRRVQRPAFWELNPFRIYLTPNSYSEGNPYLLPAFTTELSIKGVINSIHNISFYAGKTEDFFTQVTRQYDSGNTIVYTRANLSRQAYYGLNYNFSLQLRKWWTIVNTIDVSLNTQNSTYLGSAVETSVLTVNTYLVNSFVLSQAKKINGEITANYTTPTYQGLYYLKSTAHIAAGVKAKILKGAGDFSVYFFDIFKTTKTRSSVTQIQQNNFSEQYYDMRGVRMALTYRFGKKTVQRSRDRQTGNTEEVSRVR